MSDNEYKKYPTCPYCGNQDEFIQDGYTLSDCGLEWDGDQAEWECPACREMFDIEIMIRFKTIV